MFQIMRMRRSLFTPPKDPEINLNNDYLLYSIMQTENYKKSKFYSDCFGDFALNTSWKIKNYSHDKNE
jgi:hypothetical protein